MSRFSPLQAITASIGLIAIAAVWSGLYATSAIVALILGAASVAYFCRSAFRFVLTARRRWRSPAVIVSGLVEGIALLAWLAVPWSDLYFRAVYRSRLSDYEAVCNLVESNKLRADSDGHLILPVRYAYLAAKGEVEVIPASVGHALLFYSDRGILDNFSGIVFVPETEFVADYFGGDWKSIEQLGPHWYRVASR